MKGFRFLLLIGLVLSGPTMLQAQNPKFDFEGTEVELPIFLEMIITRMGLTTTTNQTPIERVREMIVRY